MSVPVSEAFRFCPKCGAATERSGVNPLRCDQCDFTYYFTPISAVGGIVCNASGQVLMIERAKDPGRGQLGLPGGFIDAGESAEDALVREVFEEVRLDIVEYRFLATFPNLYQYGGIEIPVTDLFYVCVAKSTEGIATLDGEVSDWFFCDADSATLDRMAFASNRRALEKFLAERE